jgi:hypothetical protein
VTSDPILHPSLHSRTPSSPSHSQPSMLSPSPHPQTIKQPEFSSAWLPSKPKSANPMTPRTHSQCYTTKQDMLPEDGQNVAWLLKGAAKLCGY